MVGGGDGESNELSGFVQPGDDEAVLQAGRNLPFFLIRDLKRASAISSMVRALAPTGYGVLSSEFGSVVIALGSIVDVCIMGVGGGRMMDGESFGDSMGASGT